jgi:hypothetical protein
MDRVFERTGMYVGRDATDLAYIGVHDNRIVAGPNGSEQLTRWYALCYLAAHEMKDIE